MTNANNAKSTPPLIEAAMINEKELWEFEPLEESDRLLSILIESFPEVLAERCRNVSVFCEVKTDCEFEETDEYIALDA